MMNYVLFGIIVHFIIQKLKNKHTFLKKIYKLRKLRNLLFDRTRGEKNQIFPNWGVKYLVFLIQNKLTQKVLTITESGEEVTEETMVPFNSNQMWSKGAPNKDGYFTLTNKDSGKVLTANSASSLTIEGKIPNCEQGYFQLAVLVPHVWKGTREHGFNYSFF